MLVTEGLSADIVRGLLATPAPTVEDALRTARARCGQNPHVAVLPQGPYVLATVRGRTLSLGRAWMDDAA